MPALRLPVLRTRARGAVVPPNIVSPSIVYAGQAQAPTNIGGGYWWGGGPRIFVGPPRDPITTTIVDEDDFVEGAHVWGPSELDKARGHGFPHGSRFPGYPGSWEPPFFAERPPHGYGNRFLGGAMLEGRVSTVFTCVDLISRCLASMPILTTKDSVPVEAPPWTENPEPEIYSSIVDAIKALANSLLIRGQAYIVPTARYADGMVARWVVLNPDKVKVTARDNLPVYDVEGIGEVPRSQILHIRYQVWPGEVRGISPLEAAQRNLISADALERWGTELAVGNGIPTAILQATAKLTKRQADAIKWSWAEAAMSRGTLPAVLSGGLTYTPLNLKPSDVGLLDLRTFDEARIASVFGVPLWFVGLSVKDSSLTYNTTESAFEFLWRATLRPLSRNLMQALSGFCLPRGMVARHDAESFVAPPFNQRMQAYKTGIEADVIRVNEARAWENLEPLSEAELSARAPATVDTQPDPLAQQTNGELSA